jgi:hypothetical protein
VSLVKAVISLLCKWIHILHESVRHHAIHTCTYVYMTFKILCTCCMQISIPQSQSRVIVSTSPTCKCANRTEHWVENGNTYFRFFLKLPWGNVNRNIFPCQWMVHVSLFTYRIFTSVYLRLHCKCIEWNANRNTLAAIVLENDKQHV